MLAGLLFLFSICFQQIRANPNLDSSKISRGTKEIPIFSLCKNQGADFAVNEAISLVPYVDRYPENDTDNLDVFKYGFDTSSCKGNFRLASRAGTAFLVVLSNNLPVNRFRCTAWNVILKIRSPKQFVGFGCTRYAVHFFESPLSVNFFPSAIKQLVRMAYESHSHQTTRSTIVETTVLSSQTTSSYKNPTSLSHDLNPLSLTITPVLFGCHSDLKEWFPCDSAAGVCVSRKVACDGFNNCGLWEDEKYCLGYNSSCPNIANIHPIDDYVYYDDPTSAHHTFDGVLLFVLAFCSFLLVSILVTIIVYCVYIKRRLKNENDLNMSSYIRQFRHSFYGRRKYDRKVHHRPSDDIYTGDLLSVIPPSHPKSSLPLLTDNGSVRNYCSNSISDRSSFAMPAKCKKFF